jgi:hypothetical protein
LKTFLLTARKKCLTACHYLTHETNKQIFYKIYRSPNEIDEAAIDEAAIIKILQEAIRFDMLFTKQK